MSCTSTGVRPALAVGADVLIEVQAVEGKRAQLGGAPADTGEQLHRGGDGGPGECFEHGEGCSESSSWAITTSRQGAADLVVAAAGGGPLARADHDVIGQAGRARAPGWVRPISRQSRRNRATMVEAAVRIRRRQRPACCRCAETGEERVDVAVAQGVRVACPPSASSAQVLGHSPTAPITARTGPVVMAGQRLAAHAWAAGV